MATRHVSSWAFALALSACQALPSTAPAPDSARHVLHEDGDDHDHGHTLTSTPGVVPMPAEGLGTKWTPVSAMADASVSHHVPAVAIDGNLDTFWDNGVEAAEASLTLAFAERRPFRWARLKTGPLPDGATMKFMVSDDGERWNPVSGRAINTTWGMEIQELQGEGKYLQVHFLSKLQGPKVRFRVYEFEAYAGAEP